MRRKQQQLGLSLAVLAGIVAGCGQSPDIPSSSQSTPAVTPQLGEAMKTAYFQFNAGCDYRPYFRMVKDQFPEVAITPPEAPPKWTTVTLNEHGERMDAVRFTSSLDGPADMRWCYISARDDVERWFILPVNSDIEGFRTYVQKFAVDTENLDEPKNNHTIYQPLDGGQIAPGEEYILWFGFREAEPVELRLAIKLTPATGKEMELEGPETIAKELGLRVPLQYHQPTTLEECVEWTRHWSGFDPQTGAGFAEKGLELAPDHRDLLAMAASLHRQHGLTVNDRETGVALYRKAADRARALIEKHDDLPPNYRVMAANVLLDEARFVHRENSASAVASLRAAFEAGFTGIAQLEGADDFAFLRESPEYLALLNEWRKRLEPPGGIDYELQPHPADAVQFNGHWYKFYPGMLPWHFAHSRCREAGGYLASINSKAEADFVRITWPEGNLWLGGLFAGEDRWRWLNGEPFEYASWSPGESASSEQEPFLRAGAQGFWHSVSAWDEENLGYLCEWDR